MRLLPGNDETPGMLITWLPWAVDVRVTSVTMTGSPKLAIQLYVSLTHPLDMVMFKVTDVGRRESTVGTETYCCRGALDYSISAKPKNGTAMIPASLKVMTTVDGELVRGTTAVPDSIPEGLVFGG